MVRSSTFLVYLQSVIPGQEHKSHIRKTTLLVFLRYPPPLFCVGGHLVQERQFVLSLTLFLPTDVSFIAEYKSLNFDRHSESLYSEHKFTTSSCRFLYSDNILQNTILFEAAFLVISG